MTYKGIDMTQIILAVIAIVGMLLTKAQQKLADSKAQESAYARLGVIGLAMLADLWDELSREFQLAIADGNITADERAVLRKVIEAKIEKYSSRGELQKLAEALKLPIPGIIAWFAEYAIDRLTAAHNPANSRVSEAAYPIKEVEETAGPSIVAAGE
jgi:hypothetical protein